MNKVFSVIQRSPSGATFLDWSIHYLSGQTHFYQVKTHTWKQLSENPLINEGGALNSHLHPKNAALGNKMAIKYIEELSNLEVTDKLFSICFADLKINKAMDILGLGIEDMTSPEKMKSILDAIDNDFKNGLNTHSQHDIPIIYIHNDMLSAGINWNKRNLCSLISDEEHNSVDEVASEFFQIFFNETNSSDNVWDKREYRALNIRPFKVTARHHPLINQTHMWIHNLDLYALIDEILPEVLDFLGINLNHDRYLKWKPIAYRWQKIMNKNLSFFRNLDHILNYTVNGYSYDISNLTFNQEVIIQHMLIYKYGLNLKTWQLEKFPNNTKQLHELLEENIHPVEKIYG